MDRISHRELRNNSAHVLRRVASGERLIVTNNGVDVAQLVPREETGFAEAVRSGQVRMPSKPVSSLRSVRRVKSSLSTADLLKDARREW